MTRPDDGTLASPGDQPMIHGRIVASVEHSPKAAATPLMFGDPRADELFMAAYCEEVAHIYKSWAGRHKRRADALGVAEAGESA